MSNSKNIKFGVSVPRHDIEANWIKAKNFIPSKGEFIIYEKESDGSRTLSGELELLPNVILPGQLSEDISEDRRMTPYTYDRIKIGDGIKKVSELDFIVTANSGASGGSNLGVSDVVEEEGIGCDWIYRKWSSGKCELSRTCDISKLDSNILVTNNTISILTLETPFKVDYFAPFISVIKGTVSSFSNIEIIDSVDKTSIKLTFGKDTVNKFSIKIDGIWK